MYYMPLHADHDANAVDTVTTASARRDYYARRDVPQCRFPRLGLGSQSQADSAETRRHGKYVL